MKILLSIIFVLVANSNVFSQSIRERYNTMEKNFYTKYEGKWFDNEKNVSVHITINGIIIETEKDKKILYRKKDIYDVTSIYDFFYTIKDTFWGTDITKNVDISVDDFDKEHIILTIYSEKEDLLQERKRIKFSLTKKEKQAD